jgi:glycosyltransferase involved in cell wall biosynthesis
MSVSLSLYDVFSNIVPGLIYLFAINEFLRTFGKSDMDLLQASTSGQTLFIVFAAFVLGQLFTTFTYERWYRLFIKEHEDKTALEKTVSRFPELNINFRPVDSELLLSVIQSRDKDAAERIEGYRANAIMMRNISFGLFLIGLVELTRFFINQYAIGFLGIAVAAVLFSRIALGGAARFYGWFYRDIFRLSSLYGSTYVEVVQAFRKEAATKKG